MIANNMQPAAALRSHTTAKPGLRGLPSCNNELIAEKNANEHSIEPRLEVGVSKMEHFRAGELHEFGTHPARIAITKDISEYTPSNMMASDWVSIEKVMPKAAMRT